MDLYQKIQNQFPEDIHEPWLVGKLRDIGLIAQKYWARGQEDGRGPVLPEATEPIGRCTTRWGNTWGYIHSTLIPGKSFQYEGHEWVVVQNGEFSGSPTRLPGQWVLIARRPNPGESPEGSSIRL